MLHESDEIALNNNILSQALPVANLSDNFDFSIAPTTGEDYLSRVRYEASKNSIVIAKNIDLKKFEKNRTPQYFQPVSNKEARKEFMANYNWQCKKSIEFSQLRDRIRKEKETFLKHNIVNKKHLRFPLTKNKKDWYLYCLGQTNSSKKDLTSEDRPEQINGKEPSLNILYNMDQLFEYLVEWITIHGYSRQSFVWIYSLMCFLEKPLLPETHSSLRNLALECIKLRSELNDTNDERLTEFNLFISLVARYFQQEDLADSNE